MPDLPTSPLPTRVPGAAWAFALAWLAGFGVLQWSVVQYRVPIVATLTACCAALVVWQWRRAAVLLAPGPVALMLLGAAVVTLRVPLFNYLTPAGCSGRAAPARPWSPSAPRWPATWSRAWRRSGPTPPRASTCGSPCSRPRTGSPVA
jgi:hypothetical protein